VTTDLTQYAFTTPQALSPRQKHIWSLPGNRACYGSWCILRLDGPVQKSKLREALEQCVARHAVLRTTFSSHPGEPVPAPRLQDPTRQWIGFNSASTPEAAALLESVPFDVENGPLLHVVLTPTGAGHRLGLAAPALCADLTTLRLIAEEALRIYAGEPSPTPAIEFDEIANWQTQLLLSPSANEGLDHWARQNVSDIAIGFPWLPAASENPTITTSETYKLSAAIPAMAERLGVTEAVLLLACWQALIKRLTPHSELVIGFRADARSFRELEGALGPLSQYLPIKTPAAMETPFSAFLEEIQLRVDEAIAYQHYLKPPENADAAFVFPVCFSFTDCTWSTRAAGLTLSPLEAWTVDGRFQLELRILQTPGGFFARCCERGAVIMIDGERLAEEFQKIVSSVVDNPSAPIDRLNCVGVAEHARLVDAFNPAPFGLLESLRVDELISAQASHNPQAPAVICADQVMTFAQLNQEADRLAFFLAALGSGPERRVGLLLRRSPRMIVALLAVLKSGGAFVPLDSTTTSTRLTSIAADAGLGLILTEQCLRDRLHLSLEQMPSDRIVCMDLESMSSVSPCPIGELPQAQSQNLAYVLYTSGSTGAPKGVMVPHAGLTNYVVWASRAYHADASVGAPVHSSVTFDLTITSLFCPLVSGRAVVLLPEENTIEALAQSLQSATPYSFIKITPSHLTVLNQHLDPYRPLAPVGAFVIGGENLVGPALQLWRSKCPDARFINEYGPSETVVGCCVYEVPSGGTLDGSVPIGSPIDNTRLFVVDSGLNLVPTRAPGELCVAGIGVARGYLNDPAFTAEKFVPNPFSAMPGARFYRTGDLVRRLPDGILEFLGRLDAQVKIRGFRVELGEVEAVLARHPAIQAVCVAATERTPGQRQLVAYVKSRPGFQSNPSDYRRWTSERLPDYMVPASFVAIDQLPLTVNGKLDLSKLEETSARMNSARQITPPETETERLLAKIWSELLPVKEIGIHDNFFELGGDSITSIQVVARAHQLGLGITARNMFECQTIAELAIVAQSKLSTVDSSRPVAARAPLLPLQQWFFETARPDPRAWTQAAVIDLPASFGTQHVERAIRVATSRYDAFRIGFFDTPNGREQRIVADDPQFLFEIRDLTEWNDAFPGPTLTDAALRIRAQFDLSKGPLAGCVLFVNAPGPIDRLVLVIHHLIVDGVSWRILLQDLETLLIAPETGDRTPAARSLACAERLNEYARSPELNAQLEYWVSESRSNVPPLASCAPKGAGGVALRASGSIMASALLDDAARLLQATPQELLLTALLRVFRAKCGTDKLLVDLESHGRTGILAEVSGTPTVGALTAVFPILLSSCAEDNDSGLTQIQQQLKQLPDHGVGYGLLRYCAATRAPSLALGAMPAASVLFNYLGSFDNLLRRERSPFLAARVLPLPGEDFDQHRFAISVQITGEQVHVTWSCRDPEDQSLSADAWIDAYRQELKALCSFSVSEADQVPVVETVHPLSPLQSGMLFRSVSNPVSGEYFEQATCLLGNIQDLHLLLAAWELIVRRHSALRSAFMANERGAFEQVVYKDVRIPVRQEDWRDLSPLARKARLAEFLIEDRSIGFQVERPPLLRLALFRTGKDEYQFTLSFHHAILDGWSLHSVLGEIVAVYGGMTRGRATSLPPVTPFAEYIEWFNKQDLRAAGNFWRRILLHYRSPVHISSPQAGRATPQQPDTGSPACDCNEIAVLSVATTAALSAAAQKHRLTLATIMQGAWALILSIYSGDNDVVFGFVTSGRSAPIPGIENVVGMMMNTVPVRVLVRAESEISEWLGEIQAAWAETVQYEHTPNSTIRAASELDAGESLFETALVCENYPTQVSAAIGESGLTIGQLALEESTGLPLTLVVRPAETLSLCLTFDSARINQPTACRIVSQLVRVLEAIAASPRARVANLPLADERALARIGAEWSPARLQSRHPRCLHEWFAGQAARTPHSIAVAYEDETCTYSELDGRANTLAARLQSYGVGPDVPVVLIFEPSIAMICAILGVLKSGGFYVPIDSRQPRTRTAQIVNEVGPPVILAQSHLAPIAPPEFEILITDDIDTWDAALPSAFPSDPQNLAYLIYTSGSTGKPKGVQITHAAASILFLTADTLFGFKPADVWTMFHSYTFDFAVWEMWGALLFGGKLVLVPAWMTRSPEDFCDLLDESGITILSQTPSALRMLIGVSPGATRPRSVRLIVSGGEALDFKILAPWFESSPTTCRIVNMYGITETTVHVTHRDVVAADLACPVRGFIGGALSSLRIYILDREMRPSPPGVPGEIYVGGGQLARGYWRRPDLTAERFVPDPFSPIPGERLYQSGDLARWHENDELEYLGRADRQVKVRGFRVELGEIEAALRRCHKVRDAAVLQRSENGSSRLVAYVVRQDSSAADELRPQMLELLPEYMIPASFVQLPALPLTLNGKLDRDALPAHDELAAPEIKAYVAPRSPSESIMAAIWEEVLGIPRISIHDNFFALGGDSILSLQVASQARQKGLAITPMSVFRLPTIAGLVAGGIEESKPNPVPAGVEKPLTPIQLWFFEQNMANPHFWNQAVLLAANPQLKFVHLDAAVQALIHHHEALRGRFTPECTRWCRHTVLEEARLLAEVDLSCVPDQARHEIIASCAAQANAALHLTDGPLQRWLLFTREPGAESLLLIAIHHLVIDTVSWRILIEDLESAYDQLSRGETAQLPPQSSSYEQWAQALSGHSRGFENTAEGSYWLGREFPDAQPIPVDFSELANIEASRRIETCRFDVEQTDAFLSALSASAASVEDALLTALAAAWQQWAHQDVLFIDIEHHGREEIRADVDVSRTVGWFTTLTPVAIATSHRSGMRALLAGIHEQMREIPRRGIGYGILRYLSKDSSIQSATSSNMGAQRTLRPATPEIVLNYLGHLGRHGRPSRFTLVEDLDFPVRDPHAARSHVLELSANIIRGSLNVSWFYSERRHRLASLRTLMNHFNTALKELLIDCAAGAPSTSTASSASAS